MTRRLLLFAVWGTLAVLVAAILVIESGTREPARDPNLEKRLFSFQESEVDQVDLFYKGRLATFLRSPGGLWFQHDTAHRHDPTAEGRAIAPAKTEASASTGPQPVLPAEAAAPVAEPHGHAEPDAAKAEELAKAIDFIARTIIDRRITPTQPLREYELENPPIALIFYPRASEGTVGSRPLAALYVGAKLPSNLAYYTQLSGDRDLTLIPLYQVNRLVFIAFGIELAPPPGQLTPRPAPLPGIPGGVDAPKSPSPQN